MENNFKEDRNSYSGKTFEWLKNCEELETDPNAQYELGVRYTDDAYDNPHDKKKGCEYLRRAMQAGHQEAKSQLDYILINEVNYTNYWIQYLFNYAIECHESGIGIDDELLYDCNQLVKVYFEEHTSLTNTIEVYCSTRTRKFKPENLYALNVEIIRKFKDICESIRKEQREKYLKEQKTARIKSICFVIFLLLVVAALAYFINIEVALKMSLVLSISFVPAIFCYCNPLDWNEWGDGLEGAEANGAAGGGCMLMLVKGFFMTVWPAVCFIAGMVWFFKSL